MTTATLTVTLELDDCTPPGLAAILKDIANGSIRGVIADEWQEGGRYLLGYEGPRVRSVTIAHDGVEIKEN